MGAIFSRRSSGSPSSPNPNATITEHDRAVLNLKNQRDRLQKYERQLEALTAKEIEAAKTLLQQGDKKRALMCMKRKKLRERDLANITGLLDNVHHTISTLEFAKVQVDVVSSLKDGSEALKRLNDLMNIDKVDLIMADTAEAIAYQNGATNARPV
ncbi:hypothetical protein H696_02873 [Fonticula alba]|uniref:Charged multivesicular body protein 6 n=1 Tax=Fonticula alba TaxID=691883 RepID=A0A058Z8X0_FONAL|nr:hypothetical protein H696_02873 [Fonticula alba]KCV70526.1 hypothetical protein H696_02873 [Fonticula alba]|eukprot:XP_009495042.1 hypothetical protein H696_02873 [Fonticula alba]